MISFKCDMGKTEIRVEGNGMVVKAEFETLFTSLYPRLLSSNKELGEFFKSMILRNIKDGVMFEKDDSKQRELIEKSLEGQKLKDEEQRKKQKQEQDEYLKKLDNMNSHELKQELLKQINELANSLINEDEDKKDSDEIISN